MKKYLLILSFLTSFFHSYSQCDNLIISEYIEGSSQNKAIEIYNPTAFSIPLTGNVAIRLYFNGSTTPTTFNLTGTIAPNDVFVFAHASADPAILAVADQTTSSPLFNGDDAVELYNVLLSTPIDVIGVIGVDPGTEWLVNGVSGTMDKTLVRKQTVQSPNLTWTGSGETEWDIHPNNTFSFLGSHTMDPCGPQPLTCDFDFMDHCLGATAYFTSTVSGGDGNYSYSWDFGDGNNSTLQHPSHTYSSDGMYTITLTVTDGTMATDVATHNIIVFQPPIVTLTPTGGNGCAPDTITFENSIIGSSPYSYLWIFSNGNSSTDVEPVEIFNEEFPTVSVTVTDANGCSTTINDGGTLTMPDDASFNYSSSVYCINDASPTPTITGLSGGTFTGPTGTNPTTGQLDLFTLNIGTHSITYTTNGTCPSTSMVIITIINQYDATITPAGPFCELGVPTNLTAVDAGGTWSGNGIIDANLGTFDASAAGVGTHTITYTISGTCGDTDTETIEVLANAVVDIYNSDTTICNDIFGFFLSAAPGGTWSGVNVGDNADGTGFFSSAAITPGTYTATYTISGQCGDQGSIQINVFDYPVADFTYSGTFTVNFTDASTNATSWSWDFDDSGATSTSQNPSHTYTANGSYNVCLTVTNTAGCENIYCETITITGIGIEENVSLKWNVYPNPSNGNFTIESNSAIKSISVKDLIGKNVYSKNSNSVNTQISLDDVNSGFYFIEIETENGKAVKRVEVVR